MSLVNTTDRSHQEIAPAANPPSLAQQLKAKESQFQAALPAHIPAERFMRVVLTAVQNNPALQRADRASFFTSAIKAAQDGLLPDGREGALVIYRSKDRDDNGREVWVDKVQWMPMIAGLRKKVRNSGEIATWDAQVVYANDFFEYELGDDPFIKHKPALTGEPGPVVAAYSVATLKSGEKSREVMTRAQLEKVRSVSKSKDRGPWVDWFDEMCRKSVARRHSKVLPMSTDLDDLIRRDDDLYDMAGAREEAKSLTGGRPQSIAGRLDALASLPGRENAPAVEKGEEAQVDTPSLANDAPASEPSGQEEPSAERGQGNGAEADASHAPTPENPAKAALLEKLSAKATKGSATLRRALSTISEADEAFLTDADHERLGAIAEEADGRAGAAA